MKRILIVDDDATIRDSLSEALVDGSTAVSVAEDAERALAMIDESLPDVVLSDVRMPGLDGLSLLKLLRERAPTVDVLLMTAFDDMSTVVSAMREGACDFLVKPLDLHDLRRVLTRVFEDRRTRERARRAVEEEASGYRLDELVGHNPRLIDIYKLVGQLAASRANVLIHGETGTGKELIARAIHFNSPDASEPFIPVNCTAFAPTLLESELFGHVKGAFTGAVADHRGRFALARIQNESETRFCRSSPQTKYCSRTSPRHARARRRRQRFSATTWAISRKSGVRPPSQSAISERPRP
jgi:DNA-binding NtrC family response regulator